MFDDDIEYASAIAFVFDGTTLPSIESDLRAHGATVADGTCSHCNGTLFNHKYEVVCANCSAVIGAESSRTTRISRWTYFNDNRSKYPNSQKHRCVGGFPQAYSWVKSADIDEPVSSVDPNQFYK